MRTATITPLPQPSDAASLRDVDPAPQDARLARARTALNTLAARSRKSATTGKDNLVAALTALVTLDGKLRRRRRRSWAGAGPSSRSGSVSFTEAEPEVREYELTPRELWEKLVRWEELRAYASSTEGRSAIKSVHALLRARLDDARRQRAGGVLRM
eukprot:COSAG04_NODE_1108_length_8231_cov_5.606247_5_plen_157_part_00